MAVYADSDQRLPEEIPLGLADGMIAAIVDQENLDRHLVVDDGLQLLKIHLDAALTGQQDDVVLAVSVPLKFRIMGCHAGTDRCRQIVTHGSDCGVG